MKIDRAAIAKEIAKTDDSNYHSGGWKTACTCAVLAAFSIDKNSFKYSQTTQDVVNILKRRGYSVSQRHLQYRGKTVPQLKGRMYEFGVYLVMTQGHVLLIDHNANIIVDTAPKKNDQRKIIGIWKISKKH